MRNGTIRRAMGVLAILVLAAGAASAQQMTIGTPFRTLNENFYERMAVGFAGNYQGFNFTVGSYPLAVPQFGGYQAGAGLTSGFSIVGPKGRLNFALDLNQGDTRTNVSQTPMVTLMNGQQGFFSDSSQTPFVMSVIPVVAAPNFGPVFSPQPLLDVPGMAMPAPNPRVQAMRQAMANPGAAPPDGAPAAANPPAKPQAAREEPPVAADPLAAAQESTAGRPAPSVAEARRMHAQEQAAGDAELQALFERGQAAEEDGKPGAAKVYYRQVARRASGDLKDRALAKLDELRGTSPSH